jgi:hypothetical protein
MESPQIISIIYNGSVSGPATPTGEEEFCCSSIKIALTEEIKMAYFIIPAAGIDLVSKNMGK